MSAQNTDTERRVDDALEYVHDFYEANGEWPTRRDYADFLGRYDSKSLPGVRAAINRGLLGYIADNRLAPREVVDAFWAEWRAHNTESSRD